MDPRFWPDRRVLVTGHTGFKGGWLTLWLRLLGARVWGYALAPETTPNLFEAGELASCCERSTCADIRDLPALRTAFTAAAPEIVFHLAAQPLVRRSYALPVETYATNVMGTVHLLEAARHTASVKAVVVVTSDKCYENREWEWGYRENDALGGHDPYSNSKACAELVTAAYRTSYLGTGGPAVATARAGNVIGGGDWSEDRLLPDLIRALGAQEPSPIRNPGAIRPWQHVLEPLAGYLLLAERLAGGAAGGRAAAGGWNFGPSDADAVTVGEVATGVMRRWGATPGWERDAPGEQPHEASCLRLDSSKARAHLGWRRRMELGMALDWTVAWYRRFAEAPREARAHTEAQIRQYQELSPRD